MITKIFINRENELKVLEERYRKKGFEFIPIYGRRVGKTELILQMVE
ncbi:MAG: ATP-binding protein [Candidatus Gerdarchaeota archaeon]|nr:MAG: ATP-binding protein [Candidatus Gerdarchaeota archaeon]